MCKSCRVPWVQAMATKYYASSFDLSLELNDRSLLRLTFLHLFPSASQIISIKSRSHLATLFTSQLIYKSLYQRQTDWLTLAIYLSLPCPCDIAAHRKDKMQGLVRRRDRQTDRVFTSTVYLRIEISRNMSYKKLLIHCCVHLPFLVSLFSVGQLSDCFKEFNSIRSILWSCSITHLSCMRI